MELLKKESRVKKIINNLSSPVKNSTTHQKYLKISNPVCQTTTILKRIPKASHDTTIMKKRRQSQRRRRKIILGMILNQRRTVARKKKNKIGMIMRIGVKELLKIKNLRVINLKKKRLSNIIIK